MAQTALDLGFAVDVIRFANRTFTPRDPYDLLVEPRYNMERLAAAGVMLRPYC